VLASGVNKGASSLVSITGASVTPGQPHVIWRRIGTYAIFTPPPGR
jgi:hypothetical protein